jgi:protein tyrosine phosphatase (PTP) superfamily phosphohydrolase (DUF442 family)
MPLIFASAMGSDTLVESNQAKHRLYTDLTAALPRAEVRRVDDAGHSGIICLRPDWE